MLGGGEGGKGGHRCEGGREGGGVVVWLDWPRKVGGGGGHPPDLNDCPPRF